MSGEISDKLHIMRLGAGDADAFRKLRLLALSECPESFSSSFEEEANLPLSFFSDRLRHGIAFGGWSGKELIGFAGLTLRDRLKLRHKSVVWGMFVRRDARGKGVGRGLLDHLLQHARPNCEEVLLGVVAGNLSAHRLYARAGFVEYAREPRAIKIGADYHDEILMRLVFS